MSNLSGMKRIMTIVALVLTAGLVGAAPAGARTTWEAETSGLPVATQIGTWTETDGGSSARLEFTGGHVLGPGTTFRGRWTSPWTPADKQPVMGFEYEMNNINDLGRDIELEIAVRIRERNQKWSQWLGSEYILEPGSNYMGGGGEFAGFEARSVRLQWKIEGTISAPTYLEGFAEVRSN